MSKESGLCRPHRGTSSFNLTHIRGTVPQRFVKSSSPCLEKAADDGPEAERSDPAHVDSISAYFNAIRKIPLLGKSSEVKFAKLVAAGDRGARDAMIVANLRLVVSIARRYQGRGVPLPDLIEEGNISLIKAVEKFKASKGCRFSTYATYWIRQALDRSISNHSSTIRLPIHVRTDLKRIAVAVRSFHGGCGAAPDAREVSMRTGLAADYIAWLETLNVSTCPIETKTGLNDDKYESRSIERMADAKCPPPNVILERLAELKELKHGLEALEASERTILDLRFGLTGHESETLESIGVTLGVTRERVRQIEKRALLKLRALLSHEV